MERLGNISIEKIWEDAFCFEIRLIIESEYVKAWQNCYFDSVSISRLCSFLSDYCSGSRNTDYYESGPKQGNYTPSFSIGLKDDNTGHITIEADLEINDTKDRNHRCVCNLNTELGLLERFAKNLSKLVQAEIGFSVSLLDE